MSMYAVTNIKMQIACFMVVEFISLMYFTSKARDKRIRLHRTFALVLTAVLVHIVFDGALVLVLHHYSQTLNYSPDEFPRWLNDLLRASVMTMLLALYLFYVHIIFIIHEGRESRTVSGYVSQAIFIVTEIVMVFTPIRYTKEGIAAHNNGSLSKITSLAVVVAVMAVAVRVLTARKRLKSQELMAIISAVIAEFLVLLLQMLVPGLSIESLGITLMVIAFYFVLENPSTYMLDIVKKEKARADAANAAKSKYVSVVSHEIRTPMNAVIGMTDLLLKTNVDDKQRKYLENMKRSGQALVSIVNDILDSSKIEAGKMEIIEKPYDIRDLLDDTSLIIKDRVGSKPIRISCEIDESIPEYICGDAVRIRQIIINLMNNSVKFTDRGSVSLELRLVSRDSSSCSIRFSVKDTGQGIKPEDLDKLFKAFGQVNKEQNHEKEGTGLGLSISSDLIALMGGQLEVRSEWGKGSEFYFTVRQGVVSEHEMHSETKKEAHINGLVILLVDDTELNLEIEKEIFEMNGASADTALSGHEALELLGKKHYDMIFTDYVMPEMSGTEFTRAVRSMEGEHFKNVPVIAITGDTSEDAKSEFTKAGITDFTEKPVDINKLLAAAAKWAPSAEERRQKALN